MSINITSDNGMLTIKNFEKLIGKSFVLPNFYGYHVIEASEYISPITSNCMYIVTLQPSHNQINTSFSLYRDIKENEDGYRLYNIDYADYTIIKLESLKDIRAFSDTLQKELEWISKKT